METAMDPVSPLSLQPALKPSWNPLRCTGTDLPTNLTIMVKALAFVLLVEGQVKRLPFPWLPFIPGVDAIPPLLFQGTLQVIFVIGMFLVIFNRSVRIGSLLIGAVTLMGCLSSKLFQGHNELCCALVFILAGLYDPEAPNYWRWQFMIIYFGAGLNKVLTPDWRNGIFFEHFGTAALHEPFYIWLNSKLPHMWLAWFMSWSTIITELGMVVLLAFRRLVFWAILANLFFQLNLMFFIGGTFGVFTYGMCAASLALVVWPPSPVPVVYDPDRGFARVAMRFFKAWDVDHRYLWSPYEAAAGAKYGISNIALGKGLRVLANKKVYSGFRALRMLVLLNPITYFFMGSLLAASDYIRGVPGEAYPSATYLRIVGGLFVVLLFPPLAWIADMISGEKDVRSRESAVALSEVSQS